MTMINLFRKAKPLDDTEASIIINASQATRNAVIERSTDMILITIDNSDLSMTVKLDIANDAAEISARAHEDCEKSLRRALPGYPAAYWHLVG